MLRHRMVSGEPTIEYAELLLRERAALDAVCVQHGGVRGEARPDRRGGIIARPVDDRAQVLPIRLVFEVLGAWLGAGDDQAVKRRVPQLGNIAIFSGQCPAHIFAARHLRNHEQFQEHDARRRGFADQFGELPLRGLERGIGHVVDEPDGDAIRGVEFGRGSTGVEEQRHGFTPASPYSAASSERGDCEALSA